MPGKGCYAALNICDAKLTNFCSTTAARSLIITATLVQDPEKAGNSTPSINVSASFHINLDSIRTLSTQNAPKQGPLKGLLAVPDLSGDDPCKNSTSPFIPSNVTRFKDVAPSGFPVIGLAPWISPNCSQSFMDASRHAGSEALLFFQPAGGNTEPPPANNAAWLLSNGHSWEKEITYPVYAIPGTVGNSLMERLSWNPSTGIALPGQQNTSEALSASAKWNIRLFSLINLEKSGRKSPSFWGFLLATLGTISVFCIVCLLLYQLIQRRRRENMQQRLEADGERNPQFVLQHIKIPREFLARLPVYIYPVLDGDGEDVAKQDAFSDGKHPETANAESANATQAAIENNSKTKAQTLESNGHGQKGGTNDIKISQSPQSATARIENIIHRVASREPFPPRRVNPEQMNRLSLSQTTCAICLDDFVPASSVVRELPCGHIFHPECIDASLTRSSSLCPLCKKSVLDPNFCPISVPEAVYQNSMPGSWL
ncbi:hypothetical protein BDW69DRAFT_66409 [Aspergillus filifer]